MCKFFSFVSNGKGKFFYFDDVERRKLLKENHEDYDPDSHTSIVHKFISKNGVDEDKCNKYEYTNGILKVYQINTTDDSKQAKAWIESFSKTKTFQKICVEAVKRNLWCIDYLTEEQKTPEVCLAAVKQNGYNVKHLTEKQRTAEVCLEAVKQNGNSIYYLTNKQRTPEVCLAAVKQDGCAIRFLTKKQRTLDVCLEAVKQNSYVIQHLTEIQKEYINKKLLEMGKKNELQK